MEQNKEAPHSTKLVLEIEVEVGFNAEKPEFMTHDYPGHAADIELISLKIDGLTLPEEVYYRILANHVGEIVSACWEVLEEMATADAVADADARNDLLRNR